MGYRPGDRDRLAAAFGHPGVADAYRHRPPCLPDLAVVAQLAWGRPATGT